MDKYTRILLTVVIAAGLCLVMSLLIILFGNSDLRGIM